MPATDTLPPLENVANNPLDQVLLLLNGIRESQEEMKKTQDDMKEDYNKLKKKIDSRSRPVRGDYSVDDTIKQATNYLDYGQDYISMLVDTYNGNEDEAHKLLLTCAKDKRFDNIVRLFGRLYLHDDNEDNWIIKPLDRRTQRFSYVNRDGETVADSYSYKIFEIFMCNYRNAVLTIINKNILAALSDTCSKPDDTEDILNHFLGANDIDKLYNNYDALSRRPDEFYKKLAKNYYSYLK